MLDTAKWSMKTGLTLVIFSMAALYVPGYPDPLNTGWILIVLAVVLFLLAMLVEGFKTHFADKPTPK